MIDSRGAADDPKRPPVTNLKTEQIYAVRGDEMGKMQLNFVVPAFAIVSLLTGEHSCGELRIIIPNNYDIELSEQEKAELTEVPGSLVRNASELLLTSIKAGEGDAWLMDQRDDPRNEYPLMMIVRYPAITVNDYRTFKPGVLCEGFYDPVIWDYCLESSDSFLNIPGYNQIHINHESITFESVGDMYAFLEGAELESPTGAQISSKGVHNLLFNSRVGLYHLIGETRNKEGFTINLRPIENHDGAKYEISDWSCQ